MKYTLIKYLAVAALAGLLPERASAATTVGLELGLLVDVSGSVSTAEWELQRNGYVAAFQSPAVHTAIAGLTNGLAVSYVQWSSNQQLSVAWTHINTAADANAFAAAILAAARPGSGTIGTQTGVGDALTFGTDLFASNSYDSGRQVIDVSGDGESNEGNNAIFGRNYASSNGIDVINGLPIGGGASLAAYYQNNIQYGANSFTLPVDSFDDFRPAIERKLVAEITNTPPTGVPEGGPGLVMSGLVLLGLAGVRKKFASRA